MKRPENHLSLDSLELYLMNRANQTQEQEIEEHLLVCGRCRSTAMALEHEIEVIRSTLGPLSGLAGHFTHLLSCASAQG